jgi:hypothetical protein
MKTNIAEHAEARAVSAGRRTNLGVKGPAILFLAFSLIFGATGCEDSYSTYPGPGYGPRYAGGPYATGPYVGGPGPYAPGPYAPGYAPYAGGVAIEIGDRPYYTRGTGYYVGHNYYVWNPGHWRKVNGSRRWVHGQYVMRGPSVQGPQGESPSR